MHIVVTGATGFIGRGLMAQLVAQGHACTILSRRPLPDRAGLRHVVWNPVSTDWYPVLEGADAVVNLAGEPVAGKRWTTAQKERIRHSRVHGTEAVVSAIAAAARKPRVLINASATGYYGNRGNELLTESSPPGNDFLAEVVTAWEQATHKAGHHGVRVVCLRFGIVLGPDGGVLARVLPLFRFGLGGTLGSGHQWMSWIHRDDAVAIITHALTNDEVRGPINAVSPQPVTNHDFTRALGHVLHRPTLCPVPAFALRLLLGEQAALPLTSARVMPQQASTHAFSFRYPALEAALRAIIINIGPDARSPLSRPQ